jgi:hypothetical protein
MRRHHLGIHYSDAAKLTLHLALNLAPDAALLSVGCAFDGCFHVALPVRVVDDSNGDDAGWYPTDDSEMQEAQEQAKADATFEDDSDTRQKEREQIHHSYSPLMARNIFISMT